MTIIAKIITATYFSPLGTNVLYLLCSIFITILPFIVLPNLQMWKLRLREAKQYLQCHQINKLWRQDLNCVLSRFRSCYLLKSFLFYLLPLSHYLQDRIFTFSAMWTWTWMTQLLLFLNFISCQVHSLCYIHSELLSASDHSLPFCISYLCKCSLSGNVFLQGSH